MASQKLTQDDYENVDAFSGFVLVNYRGGQLTQDRAEGGTRS